MYDVKCKMYNAQCKMFVQASNIYPLYSPYPVPFVIFKYHFTQI